MSAKKTILGKIIILSLSLFLIFGYSCIDKKYDLTKDISTVIGMGGELSFPLGETETKLLRDLLKPEDIEDLTTDDDQYGIHKMEHVNANIPTFDPISINPIDAFSNFNISFEKLTIDPIKIEEQQPEILLNKKIIDEPTIDQSFSGSVVSNIEIAPISLSTGGSINLPNIRLNLTEHQTS